MQLKVLKEHTLKRPYSPDYSVQNRWYWDNRLTHTHTHSLIHTHKNTHTHSHSHSTHTHTHTIIHTHTHTHTHTHKHTDTQTDRHTVTWAFICIGYCRGAHAELG